MKKEIEWISVTDRLPTNPRTVQVCFKFDDCPKVVYAFYNYQERWLDVEHEESFSHPVAYWAEVPKGPQR